MTERGLIVRDPDSGSAPVESWRSAGDPSGVPFEVDLGRLEDVVPWLQWLRDHFHNDLRSNGTLAQISRTHGNGRIFGGFPAAGAVSNKHGQYYKAANTELQAVGDELDMMIDALG